MKPAIATIVTLCALVGAGAASAKQMPRFIDADHRTSLIVPAAGEGRPAAEAAGADPLLEQLEIPDSEPYEPPAAEHKIPAMVAAHIPPVPEPSGVVMLTCGLLLLLAASTQGRSAVFKYTNRKLPTLPLKLK